MKGTKEMGAFQQSAGEKEDRENADLRVLLQPLPHDLQFLFILHQHGQATELPPVP
jgi:hypothetical protein